MELASQPSRILTLGVIAQDWFFYRYDQGKHKDDPHFELLNGFTNLSVHTIKALISAESTVVDWISDCEGCTRCHVCTLGSQKSNVPCGRRYQDLIISDGPTFARKAVAGVANVAESKPSDTTTEEYPNLNPVDETVVDLLAPFARTPVASVADAAILEPLNQLKGEPVCVPVSALLPKSIGIQRQSLRYTLQEGGGTILGGAGDTVDDLLQTLIEQWPDELILVMQDNLELYHRP